MNSIKAGKLLGDMRKIGIFYNIAHNARDPYDVFNLV